MTSYEKLKNMSTDELSKFILANFMNDGISIDPCVGMDAVDIIAEWLNREVEE